MERNVFKVANVRKAFFLILFFIFLLFGFQVFAAACNKPPAWNKAGTCTVDIYYEDPSGGSDLDGCYYTTENGISPSCPTNGSWSSACNCSGLSTTTCPVTILIGSTGDCYTNGEGACKICSKATDTAGNTGYGELSLNIDFAAPTVWVIGAPASWQRTDAQVSVGCSDTESGCDSSNYKLKTSTSAGSCSTNYSDYTLTSPQTISSHLWVCAAAKDMVGNEGFSQPREEFKIDKEKPVSEITSPEAGSTQTADFPVSVTDYDQPLGVEGVDNSGINTTACYYYVFDSLEGQTRASTLRTCDGSFPVTVSPTGDCRTIDGTCTVFVYAYDKAGNTNIENPDSRTFNIAIPDTTPPYRVSWDPLSRDCTNANTDISVTVEYADLDSGMAETRYCWTEGASCAPTTLFANPDGGTATQSSTGNWTLCVEATDNAFSPNSITECSTDWGGTYIVDKQAPDSPIFNPSLRTWSNEDVSVIVTYTDNLCGITYTRHCWTEGASCEPGTTEASTFTNGSSVIKTETGIWTLCARARDGAGNWRETDCSGPYKIDKTLPSGTLEVTPESPEVGQDITITISANDGESGMDYLLAEDDGIYLPAEGCGGAASCDKSWIVQETVVGDHTYRGLIYDLATNVNNTTPYYITITVREADTTPPYRVSWDPLSRDCTNANTDISVTVEYADLDSDMAETKYCWTTGASCTPTISFPNPWGGTATQSSTGNWTLCVEATDNAFSPNSVTECSTDWGGKYIVDKQSPDLPTFDPTSRSWDNTDVSVTVTYTDNLCGITYTRHCWTEGASCEPGTIEASTFTNGGSVNQTENGEWTLCTRARDGAGNWRNTDCSGPYQIDKIGPLVGEISPTSALINEPETFSANVSDNIEVTNCWLYIFGGEYGEWPGTNDGEMDSSLPCQGCNVSKEHTFSSEGEYSLYALCLDEAGNPGSGTPVIVKVTTPDTTPPYRVSWDPLSRDCTNANTDISVTIQYADLDSDMAETKYCWTEGASCVPTALFINPNGGTATQSSTGNWTLCVEATDNAFSLNSITECEGTYIVDKLPPNLPTFDPTSRDWSFEDVSVIVTYADNLCGITYTRHCWTEGASCEPGTIEAGTFTNGTSITKSDNGVWTLCARARDGIGNWRSTDCFGPYQIDKQAPVVGAIFPTTAQQGVPRTFSASVQDEISQISVCWFYVEWAFASADVNYSDTPCTDCTVSVYYTFDEARDYDNVFFLCEDAAGNLNTVNPVIVHVEPPPSLSVDLVAVPPFGTGPLSDVDLIASVFGTITGTINYEFYCEDGEALTCSNIGVANATYSLSQCITDTGSGSFCDYSVTSIAKVIIERGDSCEGALIECTNGQTCCRVRKVDIYIGGDQPPVCGISVPPITTVSTPIYIEVGSSYDPEGAMATVRFSSDDSQDGNPTGEWTSSYNWNTSEGDYWDAVNKKMKWGFTETGTYEVWTEVEDSVGQPFPCYDTIAVTECIPGDTKSCVSDYGCSHTLTCTAQGTWPSDCGPADECTPGETSSVGCGPGELKICTDSCTWGPCVGEPTDGCPWPPDKTCSPCQQLNCNTVTNEWECIADPAAAGTDCGDCLLCNDLGECNVNLCDWSTEECECIPGTPDSCWNCNNYGTECGYQGVCSCGPLETPTWSCFGGVCQCTCNLDLITCDEPPPGCQEDYPGVAIIPSRYARTAGTQVTYTVFVINRDEGQDCPDVTFDLTTGGYCNDLDWDCELGISPPQLTIPSGQSAETTLTVTSPEPYSRGDYQISVTATRQ